MSVFLQVAVIGLAKSGIIAMLAIGIVLIYRTTGVVNLAHWAMGLLGVVVYVLVSQSTPLPNALVAVVGIAAAVGAGLVSQRLVFSRLRRGDGVTMILIALGVGAFLAAVAQMLLRGQRGEILVEPTLPTGQLVLAGTVTTYAELITIAVAIGTAAVLLPWLQRSRTGRALRAVAQNREAAELAGIDATRYAELAWMIGSGLAGAALLLLIPHSAGERGGVLSVVHLVPLGSLLIPAFGAALVGGMISLNAALAGSLIFGLVQEVLILAPAPIADERDILAYVVITVLLLLRTERFFATNAELEALRA
ncbi:MAG: branched-chain amino acid ABC transporter permease [Actinobacteria bacterium]|nr:branched-chain amino acid ABC transporter permease [Actinomycetota bacterium]